MEVPHADLSKVTGVVLLLDLCQHANLLEFCTSLEYWCVEPCPCWCGGGADHQRDHDHPGAFGACLRGRAHETHGHDWGNETLARAQKSFVHGASSVGEATPVRAMGGQQAQQFNPSIVIFLGMAREEEHTACGSSTFE